MAQSERVTAFRPDYAAAVATAKTSGAMASVRFGSVKWGPVGLTCSVQYSPGINRIACAGDHLDQRRFRGGEDDARE